MGGGKLLTAVGKTKTASVETVKWAQKRPPRRESIYKFGGS